MDEIEYTKPLLVPAADMVIGVMRPKLSAGENFVLQVLKSRSRPAPRFVVYLDVCDPKSVDYWLAEIRLRRTEADRWADDGGRS